MQLLRRTPSVLHALNFCTASIALHRLLHHTQKGAAAVSVLLSSAGHLQHKAKQVTQQLVANKMLMLLSQTCLSKPSYMCATVQMANYYYAIQHLSVNCLPCRLCPRTHSSMAEGR